jgi:hypothetical protein
MPVRLVLLRVKLVAEAKGAAARKIAARQLAVRTNFPREMARIEEYTFP